MDTGKRLTYYIEKQGFTKKGFCETFDIDYNSFVRILADKRPIGINVLHQVHQALPKMNVHWVLYNAGSMEVDSLNIVNEPSEIYKVKNDSFESLLMDSLKKDSIKEQIISIITDEQKK
ncbi:MAG: hypothetical protein V4670_12230 [Bacteroidota bacterium]